MPGRHISRMIRLILFLSIMSLCFSCDGGGGGGSGDTPGAEETNANIASIQLSAGSMVFQPDTTAYNVEVANAVTTLTVTVTLANGDASFTVNGAAARSGEPCNAALSVGTNTISINVTSEQGSTSKTYTLVVKRLSETSHNPDLSGLALSTGTLSPAFSANTTSYTAQVGNSTSSLTLTPTAAGVNASITVNNAGVASGSASAALPLAVGANTITVVVKAEDGSASKTYTIVVTRLTAEESSNASLANISLAQGILSPVFNGNTLAYTAQVSYSITTATVTPTAAGVGATILVNGSSVDSGRPAQAIALAVGSNPITIEVTAQDGTTKKAYTITITRLAYVSNNAYLAGLSLSSGSTLSPAFSSYTTSYSTAVTSSLLTVSVTPTASHTAATITVNGKTVVSGTASDAIPLSIGANPITIVVTAQDTTTKRTYSLTVTKVIGVWTWAAGDSVAEKVPDYGANGIAAATNTPGARDDSYSWTDSSGNLWIFGGHDEGVSLAWNDFSDVWKFDGVNWTWVAGSRDLNATDNYGTRGVASSSCFPGGRSDSATWSDGKGNFWVFGGNRYNDTLKTWNYFNDLWKFNGAQWTWLAGDSTTDQPGDYGMKGVPALTNRPGARYKSTSWIDNEGILWLFGGFTHNDLWKFDGTCWIWVAGDMVTGKGGVYGTRGTPDPANKPGGRQGALSWVDSSGNLWLLGGYGHGYGDGGAYGLLNDLWKFDGTCWTWIAGNTTTDQNGTYGIKGVPAAGNTPGCRGGCNQGKYPNGNVWIFGGVTSSEKYLNDLWKFDGTYWTLMSGSVDFDQIGVYGTKGVAASGNTPGSRMNCASWTDSSGNVWIFGGYGLDSMGKKGYMNDLWKFDGTCWTWVSGENICAQSAGTYGTKGVASIYNKPGARQVPSNISWMDSSGNLLFFGGHGAGTPNSLNEPTWGYLSDIWKFSQ